MTRPCSAGWGMQKKRQTTSWSGGGVGLHVHPYAETFVLLEGRGRWTVGEETVELRAEQIVVVPPQTPHGFLNTGDAPLLVVSVHDSGTMEQRFLDE